MNLKRILAFTIANILCYSSVVMASSNNTINKTVNVADGDQIEGVYLKILPKDEIISGDSVIITIDNGEFHKNSDSEFTSCEKEWKSPSGADWCYMMQQYTKAQKSDNIVSNIELKEILSKQLKEQSSDELPYKIEYNSKNEIQVYLYPIARIFCDNDGEISTNSPYYNIPIIAEAKGDGDVKITIDSNESNVSGGNKYTIARATSSSGSTTTTIGEVYSFQDSKELDEITIKENVKGTFESNKQVKVRVSGGFEIDKTKSDIVVSAGSNAKFNDIKVTDVNEDSFTFTMPSFSAEGETEKASAIKISGIVIVPEDEDDNWGDVSLTVSGAGISKETIVVATRADYGFKMSVIDEVPTIISGRTYIANKDLDEDDFKSATILFEETIADTWLTNRKLEFAVPEGVKIIDYDFDEFEDMADITSYASIAEEGTVLKIDLKDGKNVIDADEESSFELNLYFSIDADYVGDIPVSVSGAGLTADTLNDVIVAKAVTPIVINTATTKLNMGYQSYKTADITITETQDGVLLDGEKVIIAIDSAKFGNSEVGFNDENVDISVDGEITVKDFKVKDGEIYFTIDSTSYTEPASITISNITIGTTRSVPYGSYDIRVYGGAVVNNYDEDEADKAEYSAQPNDEGIAYFDTTEAYSFTDYLVIMTETTTLDGVVEVTIGEKTIKVNDEMVDVDVAAYIQTSSNSTMVPLRFVSIALGVDKENVNSVDESSKISWDANSKTATIFYAAGSSQKIIQFQVGNQYMIVDGTQIPMENGVVAEIVDGRMFVPFRALGTALGVSVDWDAETRTAIYK